MKRIGLIGGMSWASTLTYYTILNQVVNQKLGGMHSADCIIRSPDFEEIEKRQRSGDWDENAQILLSAAQDLEKAGADFILICANTMHKVADQVQQGISVPLLHIAEVTADALLEAGVTKAALLGTKYTMQQDFYTKKLQARGIEVVLPTPDEMERVTNVIFEELCFGNIVPQSKAFYLELIDKLAERGAGGVILGCTEIGLLVKQEETAVPLFDTALIHPTRAALYAMGLEE